MIRTLAATVVLGVASLPVAAQPAAGAAPLPEAPAAPETVVLPAREISLVREVEVGPWELRWVGGFPLGLLEPDADDAAAAIAALGGGDPPPVEFEGQGSVVVRMPSGELSAGDRAAGKPAAAFQYLSADAAEDGSLRLQRTWFALYEPRGKQADRGDKGLVVLIPGMFGTPEPVVDSLVGMLRGRGWHVLRMLTHPSRFTEKASYAIDPAGDVAGVATSIAAEFGDRAAECARAVEAVCAHIAAARPGTPVASRVGLGMSGGGMVLSTVVATNPAAYGAAVFIGAGCDFAQVAIESNYTDWIDSVHIDWLAEPDEAAAEAFTSAYRAAATLDSFNTAPLLARKPILMIHGELDQAVPAALGDLLWERLGRPERWAAALGHETLFLAYLPGKAPDLLDWLDEHAVVDADRR